MTLTNSDLTKIGKLLDDKLEPIRKQLDDKPSRKEVGLMIDQKLDDQLGSLREQISHLPTREEFYSKMDRWMKAADTSELEKATHKLDHIRINQFLRQHPIQ